MRIPLQKKEIARGFQYLLFELVFLGPLVTMILRFFFPGIAPAYVNFVYFAVNFISVGLIFRRYLVFTYRVSKKIIPKILAAAGIGFVIYWVLSFVLQFSIDKVAPNFYNINDAAIAQDSRKNYWLTALGAVLLVPMVEEVLHRGLVFGVLLPKGRLLAYSVSTCLFAFIHIMGYIGLYSPWHLLLCFVQYIPAGLVLAWAYDYCGSIFAPIAIHTAVNIIAIVNLR